MTPARQVLYWSIGCLLLGLFLWALSGILLPFVAGLAVAYFLDPLADRLERWRLPRWLATSVVLLGFVLLALLLLVLLVPVLQGQIGDLVGRLPELLATARERLLPALQEVLDRFGVDLKSDLQQAASVAAKNALSVVGQVLSGGAALLNILSLLFITPIVAFYLLRDWDLIVARIDGWLPQPHAEEIRGVARDVDRVLASFVRGQGTICVVLGTFYAACLGLAGLNFALVIGVLIGLISFIPFVGVIVGGSLAMLVAVTQFWPEWDRIAIIAGIFVLGQVLEGNVLTPRLLGSRVGLHPVWVMFALLAGGALFGFVGILLAVPGAAAVGVLVRHAHGRYMRSGLYLSPAAAPSEAAAPPDQAA